METVGTRIKERRTELGWTQDTLAQKAGISKSFLSEVENGKRSIGAETLLDLARALGCSLDFLMTGEEGADEEVITNRDIQIPAALTEFAAEASISFRQALALLGMQRQIVAHRSTSKKREFDKADWRRLYESVKEFLK